MSNAQADSLRIDVLGGVQPPRAYLALKPASLSRKQRERLQEGSVLERLDPFHLRVIRGKNILAWARLGRIGEREAIHIVSTDPEIFPEVPKKHHLLEVRLRLVGEEDPFRTGEVIEYDRPLSREMLVLIDHEPVAVAAITECDHEPVVRITRMLNG